jgi:hypothetical protein
VGVKYLVIGYNEPGFHIVPVLRKLASARISHSFFIVFDRPSVFTYGGLLGTLSARTCNANPRDASSLISNVDNVGECSNSLASGSTCIQTRAGYTCSVSSCSTRTLSEGTCNANPCDMCETGLVKRGVSLLVVLVIVAAVALIIGLALALFVECNRSVFVADLFC